MGLEGLQSLKEAVDTPDGKAIGFNILKLHDLGYEPEKLPFSIRVLLENVSRHSEHVHGALEAAHRLAKWDGSGTGELPFMPYRVLLQDYTGVPLIVDLASMRDAARAIGKDPKTVNSQVPVDLVIDHSIQVDAWGNDAAFSINLEKEYERNSERYSLLKWAQGSFQNMRVFPPGKGICHQFNLEYLSKVVAVAKMWGSSYVFPDTLVGTDSHTTMVNGMACLGWGVGGIEAEAVMLGEPYHMPVPKVLGVRLTGGLREGATPTDLVLTVTEKLRAKNVVGQFVEYFGDGYAELSVPDRATLGNMSPEYGATAGFCPVDESTLSYLKATARSLPQVDLVRRYAQAFGFFVNEVEPRYSEVIDVDIGEVEPSVAGPRNPEERRTLTSLPSAFRAILAERKSRTTAGTSESRQALVPQASKSDSVRIEDGSIVIAAITSCTNTSNPTVMVGAGLLAKKALEAGLSVKGWVKPSLAPGSTVVTDYLGKAGLLEPLYKLGFALVGYGCTTCIGQSGPLLAEVESQIRGGDLYVTAVLSGNRNFDGRIHPLVKGSFLASPMLVVAYALAGRQDFDFGTTPLGFSDERPVYLRDIWPSTAEIRRAVEGALAPELFALRYADAMKGDNRWEALASTGGDSYSWDEASTYIRNPPWFSKELSAHSDVDIHGARALVLLEDKVTTDHISPAGSILVGTPAGEYLADRGVDMVHMSSYGSRRGNHEVMVRGGFANNRLSNLLSGGREGGFTAHLPDGEVMPIFDAAVRYANEKVPLIVIGGKQYGAGSSRDWAAKAPKLLGVKAVLVESFERIHRSNLVAMGIIPLEFEEGESAESLGLTGKESFDITGLSGLTSPGSIARIVATGTSGERTFNAVVRVDNRVEIEYIRKGGVLPFVFSKLSSSEH